VFEVKKFVPARHGSESEPLVWIVKTPAGWAFVHWMAPVESNPLTPRSAERIEPAHREMMASKQRVFMVIAITMARFGFILKAKHLALHGRSHGKRKRTPEISRGPLEKLLGGVTSSASVASR
jgi:hypothetical protein